MQRYKDIPLIFTTTPEFLQTPTVDVEIPANTELEHKPNSGKGRERESKKRRRKKLNNFSVSHSFMNHSSRGQRKNLFRKHRDYFIYEWENYWDTDTGDLTQSQISSRYRRIALTTLLVAFLLAGPRRMPKGFVFNVICLFSNFCWCKPCA